MERLDIRKSWVRVAVAIFAGAFALSFLVALALCAGFDDVVGSGGSDCSLVYMVGWAARWAGFAMLFGTVFVEVRDNRH